MAFIRKHWRWGPGGAAFWTGVALVFSKETRTWGFILIGVAVALWLLALLPPFLRTIWERAVDEAAGRARIAVRADLPRPQVLVSDSDESRYRVMRANVQAVMDELASNRDEIHTADMGFWDHELRWQTWENVRDSLAGERGFHAAYEATREAYAAIIRAELTRLNHEGDFIRMTWEDSRVQEALDKIANADAALFQFLANLDTL